MITSIQIDNLHVASTIQTIPENSVFILTLHRLTTLAINYHDVKVKKNHVNFEGRKGMEVSFEYEKLQLLLVI